MAVRDEGAGHVTTTFACCQPPLARRPSGPREQRPERQPPALRKLSGQAFGGVIAASEPPIRVARDEDDTGHLRPRQGLTDYRGGPAGEPAETALLPRCDDAA